MASFEKGDIYYFTISFKRFLPGITNILSGYVKL
jgi:hypothetical protein